MKHKVWILAAVIFCFAIVMLAVYKGRGAEGERISPVEHKDRLESSSSQGAPQPSPKSANELEDSMEMMISGRPEGFQNVLDQPAPQNLQFGEPKRMSLFPVVQGELLSFSNQNQVRRNLVIDGKSILKSDLVDLRGNDKFLMCAIRGKEIEIRLFKMHNPIEGDSIEVLPKLNYHEKRRWWIQGWNLVTDTEVLGSSYEEDGKAEAIVMSHFYLYDRHTRTLRTLLAPPEVNPYQVLQIEGINEQGRVMKVSDENGQLHFMAF